MTASERRRAILIALCNRRFDRRENLANEFGVSKRTMPDKNNTNLAKTPLFMRFFANSRMVYIQYYRPRLCNKSSKISAFLLHASLTSCF